jgi:hypothetical protein
MFSCYYRVVMKGARGLSFCLRVGLSCDFCEADGVCGSPCGILFCTGSTVESVEYILNLQDSTHGHLPFISLLYITVWLKTLMPSYLR